MSGHGHEHAGHGGGETPTAVIQVMGMFFLVFPIMLDKLEQTGDELTGMAGGHGGGHGH
jgi:hypothetical protein